MRFLSSFPRVVALLLLPLVACPVPASGQRDAGRLFQELCASCHGPNLEGAKAPTLLDGTWRSGGDDESLARSIREGITSAEMPAFAGVLTPAEIRALIVLIREKSERALSPEMRGSHPLPEGVLENGGQRFRIEEVVRGLDVPWSMAFLPDGRILVTERAGRLRVIEAGVLQAEPVNGVPPVWAQDEGGLMSVTLDPEYLRNGWIYLSFSDHAGEDRSMTKIIRAKLRGNALVEHQTVYQGAPETYRHSGMNFGGRLLFSGRYLFFSIGERGAVGQAQDLTKPNGKIHRVFPDGRVPEDNPFVHVDGAVRSIWSYGNRNPQGLAVHPVTGELWETEHGPRGGDELNVILPGKNYGWPLITYGMNYDGTPVSSETAREGLEQPVRHWTPSIATCPLMFYAGDRYPAWRNQLFLGSLAQQEFLRFAVAGSRIVEESRVFQNLGRVRDIQTSPDGLIYLSLEVPRWTGRIVRLIPIE